MSVRPIYWKMLITTIIVACVVVMTGCNQQQQQKSAKRTQADIAKATAESITFTENAEIDNIKARLELTSDPGLTGFVLLMNEAGQPIMYTGVQGKITSSGKRLTKPWDVFNVNYDCGSSAYCDHVGVAPSDEGTWGSSSPYIYFWTTTGQYIQWNGKYLYSDKPFRTKVDPLVIAITE